MVRERDVPPALLFGGARGTGKTSTARILAAATERLRSMSYGDGYRTEFREVLRQWESIEEQNELPIALVLRASGSPEHVYDELAGAGALGIGQTGELITAWLDVEVWIYAAGTDSLEPATAWEYLSADAERALTLDLHLGLSPDVVWDVRKVGNIANQPVATATWYRVEGADLYRVAYFYLRGQP